VGDFRSYLVAKSKREVPGGQGVVLCQGNAKSGVYELPKSWVTVATNHMTSSQVLDAISKVNILYVDLPMVGNASQPLSSYFDLGSKPLYFSQLFSRDLPAVAVLVRWNVGALNAASQGEVMNALLKSLMFSGIPTLVIIPTGANPSSDKDWAAVANFGRGLLEKDAATFLAMADSRFRGWILLGSQGMDAGEITAYAQENFKKTVQKGNLNLQEGNTEWATRYYQRARQMAVTLGQNSVLPNIDQLLLRSAFEGKRWQEAEEVQQRLLDIATNTHDHAGVLLGWKNLAVYRTRLGNYPQALAAWDQVLVMAKESGDQPALVNTYLSQSDLFRSLRDCPKALKAVASAYEAALNAGRVDLELTALVQKGKIQFEFDDIDSSLSTLNNAQTLLDSVGASESSVALEASIFEIKGRIMAILERFPEALENTQRALKVAGSDSTRMGYLTQRMADLYWESGQLKSATQWAAKADSLFQRLGDKSYQLLNQNTRSLIRLSYGDRDEAVRLAGMALEYATDLKDSANMAIITRNMGLINLESKQPEQAILRFREAKSIDARLQRSAGLAHDLANLGLALFQAGQLDSARTSLEVAISLGQPLSDRRPEVKGYVGLALLEQQNGDYQFALERLDRAREAIQNRAMGQYLWRIWYLRASIYKQQNQASKALEADEQAISVLESDPVASGNYHPTGISLRPVDAFDHAVKTALFMGEVERAFLLSDRKRQWLREQPFQMEGLAHQPTSQSSVAWTELRQKLSSGSVLLSFHAAPDTTFMFIATRDELVVRGIARGESALRSLVEGMRTAVEKLLSVEEVSRQLCQEILSPAESWLSSAQTVYIMPDGPLWSVPFCALMDNDGHLLIDRFPIMYLTGLDRLAEMGASDAHGIQRLVAFAYPRSDVVPGELVFAEREVRRISLEDPMAIPLIDENAREVVLDTMRLVDSRVHFACHGWSALDDPLSTGLVLKADVNHDGIWTAHEIASKSLQCPLVFLNLCPPDRGIGNFRQRNLVQAFVEAGCSDIICPLWKVEDLAAAIAAKLFYRYLQEGNSSNQSKSSTTLEAETLRRAQMGVRDKVNSHPAYWAGYEFLF
jgi:CHAT domain-containing protein/tetratricopeptide (TPR) repeat protein